MTETTNQQNVFDESSKYWDEKPERVENALILTNAIIDAIKPTATMKVLEYGCGTGISCAEMAPRIAHITAIDTSEGMLEQVQQKKDKFKLENIKTDKLDLSMPENFSKCQYDFIYSMMTLHHVNDVEQLLKSFIDALEPGGKLAIADLETEDGTFHLSQEQVAHLGFDLEELSKMLLSIGFINVNAKRVHTLARYNDDGALRGNYPIFLVTAEKQL